MSAEFQPIYCKTGSDFGVYSFFLFGWFQVEIFNEIRYFMVGFAEFLIGSCGFFFCSKLSFQFRLVLLLKVCLDLPGLRWNFCRIFKWKFNEIPVSSFVEFLSWNLAISGWFIIRSSRSIFWWNVDQFLD